MKSSGVTIRMKPLQQYFYMVLCDLYVVLSCKSVDEILYGVTIRMKPLQQYFYTVLFGLYVK